MKSYSYFAPQTIPDALALLSQHEGARLLAGGTDVLPRIRKGTLQPPALVSIRRIAELTQVSFSDTIRIGSAATIGALLEHPKLCHEVPVLAQAMLNLGSQQVRNLATIGGNLINASPCADTAPPLLVLDARVEIVGSFGTRFSSLHELFDTPGQTHLGQKELLAAVLLPKQSGNFRATFRKVRRVTMDISIASLAVGLQLAKRQVVEVRIAAGSVGPRPMRLWQTEAFLREQELTQDRIEQAAELASKEVSPITDIRSTEEYRRHVIGVLLKRLVAELLVGEQL